MSTQPATGYTANPSAALPALSRRRLIASGALLAGVTALGGGSLLAGAHPARAAGVARPSVAGTATWGAAAARGSLTTVSQRPTYLVIHHTAYSNSTDYSQAAAHAKARQIQADHLAQSWADSGQHFTIGRGGHIMEGRHGSWSAVKGGTSFVRGAHAVGLNGNSVGIECDGTYTSSLPPEKLRDSLVALSAYICQQYGIGVDRIIAHRDDPQSSTACCGDALYAQLPSIRQEVKALLGGTTAPPSDTVTGRYPKMRQSDRGEPVARAQKLLTAAGHSAGTADGVFGAKTTSAVKSFQKALGTGVDGVVGPKTWGALVTHPANGTKLRNGSTGTQVTYLQRGLQATLGVSIDADGKFGAATGSALRQYQTSRGLTSDGVAGPNTWTSLKRAK